MMLNIKAGIHKMLARIANREDPNQTDLGLHCLSRPFFNRLRQLALEILEDLPY